jgi:hypothetical protein
MLERYFDLQYGNIYTSFLGYFVLFYIFYCLMDALIKGKKNVRFHDNLFYVMVYALSITISLRTTGNILIGFIISIAITPLLYRIFIICTYKFPKKDTNEKT